MTLLPLHSLMIYLQNLKRKLEALAAKRSLGKFSINGGAEIPGDILVMLHALGTTKVVSVFRHDAFDPSIHCGSEAFVHERAGVAGGNARRPRRPYGIDGHAHRVLLGAQRQRRRLVHADQFGGVPDAQALGFYRRGRAAARRR